MGYLKNELLKNIEYKENDGLRVSCGSTIFCDVKFKDYESTIKLNEKLKSILKFCKEHKIKVKNRNKIKIYKSFENNFVDAVINYNGMIHTLRSYYKRIIKRGIHYGCVDDKGLNLCHRIEWNAAKRLLAPECQQYSNFVKIINNLFNNLDDSYIAISF